MPAAERENLRRDLTTQLSRRHRQAAAWLPFDALTLQRVFTTQELAQLEKFVDQLNTATDDNHRLTLLHEQSQRIGHVLLKLLRLSAIIA